MNKRTKITLLMSIVALAGVFLSGHIFSEHVYRDKAAQMIMVGFNGMTLTPDNPIYRDIKENHIGGVILFNHQHWDRSDKRNISDYRQLKSLIRDLNGVSEVPLFVAVDQEGGKVFALWPEFGVSTYSAGELGRENDLDLTKQEAEKTAKVLKDLGINVNFAPCVDIVLNPKSIIRQKDRSFSEDNPELVAAHAEEFIKAYREAGVLPVLKHFPGHGSATGDTHEGYVDITDEYRDTELKPYQILIPKYPNVGVMVAHVFNRNVDPDQPLSLSYKNVTLNLKKSLGFDGVIFSDDLQMGALTKKHSWHDIVVKAINAGNDVLVIGNNLTYDPDIAEKTLNIIMQAIKDGEIVTDRIDESYRKIMRAKNKPIGFWNRIF